MLYGLPGKDVTNGIVAPATQAREVCGSIVNREGSVNEGYVVAVEEFVGDV
jgi:hypothetical protein